MWRKLVLVLIMTAFVLATSAQPSFAKVDKWKCVAGLMGVGLAWAGLFVAGGGIGGAIVAVVGWHFGNFTGWLGIADGCF